MDRLHKKFACALHTCSACFHMVASLCACIYIVYYTHGCTFVPWPAIVLIFGQLCSRSAFVPKLMYVKVPSKIFQSFLSYFLEGCNTEISSKLVTAQYRCTTVSEWCEQEVRDSEYREAGEKSLDR